MGNNWPDGLRAQLETKRNELTSRLDRITANVRRSLDSDSEERAKQLADSEVVDALGNEARDELQKISMALSRMESGDFGLCTECGIQIAPERIEVYPYAEQCIDCAELSEDLNARR